MESNIQRKIYIKPFDRMVKDLVEEMNQGQIVLDPDYQRNYVWDNKKASLFVESILLNIPIPVIYASEDKNGNWIIVDGLQRLNTLKRFVNDEFKLKSLEVIEDLNDRKFSEIPPEIKNRFLRGELRIILLQNESDEMIQFDIFMRLNRGAVILNEQEMRNCLYRGRFNDMIKRIVCENETFKKLIPPEKKDRMRLNENILRYLAISENFNKKDYCIMNYDGRMKDFLNRFMKKYQNTSSDVLEQFKFKFNSQIEKCFAIFGNRAFRRDANSNLVNISLFDCMMISLEEFPLELLAKHKNEICNVTNSLLNSSEFLDSISSSTNNTKNINYRLSTYYKEIKKVITGNESKI